MIIFSKGGKISMDARSIELTTDDRKQIDKAIESENQRIKDDIIRAAIEDTKFIMRRDTPGMIIH